MGTIVLPPQDCLSSPHNRKNSYFPSARSEMGRCFQAVMVPSPAAQDCARHGHSCGSPPGDGLLPIPPMNGQARLLSKRSPPLKASSTSTSTSTFCTPLLRVCQESSPPKMKPKLLRSASAILPTPLVGSPPLAEGLLKGRLPFKVVQGNGPGNNSDHVQGSASKKSSIARNAVRKRITSRSSHTTNPKTIGNFDKSNPTPKLPQDATVLRGQPKEINARLRRSLERSSSAKGTDLPAVTILQRPKTEEAAMELFVKFFQKDTKQVFEQTDKGMDGMSDKSGESSGMVKESMSGTQLAIEEVSESESFETSSCKMVWIRSPKSMSEVKKDVKAFASIGAGVITAPFEVGAHVDGEPLHGSKARVFESEELVPWERWAGPSFINSPPPSALPLPRFSKKHLKDVFSDNVHAEHLEGAASDQISTPPSSISPLYTSLARQRHLNINLDAVATATKDLKRILNLDLCRM